MDNEFLDEEGLYDEEELCTGYDDDEDDGFTSDIDEEDDLEDCEEPEENSYAERPEEPGLPPIVKQVLSFIADKIFAVIVIGIVIAFMIIGGMVIKYMSDKEADVGGVNQMIEMFENGH